MKLHLPESFWSSCVVTNISILTGWKFKTVRRKILEQRTRFKFNSKGFKNCVNYSKSVEYAFLPEINAILRSKGIKIRWRKWKGYYQDFPHKFSNGTYMVYLTNHISIVKDGMIYDNMGWNMYVGNHNLKFSTVHFYSKIS